MVLHIQLDCAQWISTLICVIPLISVSTCCIYKSCVVTCEALACCKMMHNSIFIAFIGTVKVAKSSYVRVKVKRTLYQSLSINKGQLKILLSEPPLSKSQTCCKRIAANSTYIFAGNYKIRNGKVKFIANGCQTIYTLSMGNSAILDVNNIEHSFLDQCQFRILASSS